MNVTKLSLFIVFVISVNLVFYIFTLVDEIFEESLPETHVEHYNFEFTEPKLITSCINRNVYANTTFAFVSMLSLFSGVENAVPNYIESSKKLGMSIRRFTNLDLIMMIPVDESEYKELTWIGHRIWWDDIEKASWKVCLVPVIDVTDSSVQNIRFYQAKLFSKLNAWNLLEYQGIVVLDCDMFCASTPVELFTYHFPRMLAENKTLGAHQDHPKGHIKTFTMIITSQCEAMDSYFNAGMLLIKPSRVEFSRLVHQMNGNHYNKDWCEQGMLNFEYGLSYYALPFKYNANIVSKYCEPDMWSTEKKNIVFYHFTVAKPWDEWACRFHHVEHECALWKNFHAGSQVVHVLNHHNVTVVTGFYNIHRNDRSFDCYLNWMKITFLIKYPMIIFCHPNHESLVMDARKGLPTTIITNVHFPFQNESDRVMEIIEKRNYRKILQSGLYSPEWNTKGYISMNFAKFEWVRMAAEMNPYNSEYIYWIDTGLGRFFSDEIMGASKLFIFDKVLGEKITIQMPKGEKYPPRRSFVGTQTSPFIAGIFGGKLHSMVILSKLGVSFFFNDLLKEEKVDNEQVCLGKLYWRHKSLFNVLSHSDFPLKDHCNFICI